MRTLLLLLITGFAAALSAQSMPKTAKDIDPSLPEFQLDQLDLAGQMYFLASDYLQGRRTGSIGNEIAAEYIASQLRAYGYQPINGESYFQDVPLRQVAAPVTSSLTVGETTFAGGDDLLIMRGPAAEVSGQVVFANFGVVDEESGHNDYAGLDVAGKIVITRPGYPDDFGQQGVFKGIGTKAEMAAAQGAVALYEIYLLPFPWSTFKGYLGRPRMGIDNGSPSATIPYGFINAADDFLGNLQAAENVRGSANSSGMQVDRVVSRNVGGLLPGADPALAEEHLLMTAHFDHVGVGAQGGGAYSEQDSIFNGSRDNAFGTISLLAAAKSFAEAPVRRSVIILAVTGEEMGLLGSEYYASNPLIPLEKTVYNFNTDGAGYSDTTAISLFGANRTGIDEQVQAAAEAFNTTVIQDPAPEQGLYDRSDNVSFAKRGVPALTFSPGFSEFNDTLMQYYHQVGDNPETIDYPYLKKYCQIFTLAARLIANRDVRPVWAEGDKYEAAGKELYGSW